MEAVYHNRFQAIRGLNPMPVSERSQYDITDVKAGAYISIDGVNYLVQSMAEYTETKWETFKPKKNPEVAIELELMCLSDAETIYIEYYNDDRIQVYMTEKEVRMRDVDASRQQIEYIGDEEGEGSVTYNGKVYHYDDNESWAARYRRKEGEVGMAVRFYEFEADDGESLTFEFWYDDHTDTRPDREAYISREISVRQISILQLGEA